MLILSPEDVVNRGFRHYSGLPNNYNSGCTDDAVNTFKKIYGSSPTVIANIWYDLQSKVNVVPTKLKSEIGFKKMLTAIHFVWAYPKNTKILATSFGVCV